MRGFWTAVAIIAFLFVAFLLLALPALAQDGETPPELGVGLDAFLLLALPAMVLIQTIIIQAAKWLIPDRAISTEAIAMVIKALFSAAYIGAWLLGANEQLAVGVGFLNELSDPLMKLLGLFGMWVGPSAVYEYARNRDWAFLGKRQGVDFTSFARDQDWRRAA